MNPSNPSVDIIGGAGTSDGLSVILALLFVLIGVTIGLLIALAFYVIYALGTYRLAKRLDVNYAFLAWIPYAQYFTLGKVAEKCDERQGNKARPWGLIVLIGIIGASVVSAVISAICSLLSIIPILGLVISLIGSLLSMVLALAYTVLDAVCRWKIYREYFSEPVNIVLFIVGIVLNVQPLITLIASFRQPIAVENEYIEDAEYTYEDYNA